MRREDPHRLRLEKLHSCSHTSDQVLPIARGEADMTALELTYLASLPNFEIYSALPGQARGLCLTKPLAHQHRLSPQSSVSRASSSSQP